VFLLYCQIEGVHEDGDKSMESLLMSLSTLRDATRNFSDTYKLGQGGFGPVYKVDILFRYLWYACYFFPFLCCILIEYTISINLRVNSLMDEK